MADDVPPVLRGLKPSGLLGAIKVGQGWESHSCRVLGRLALGKAVGQER